MKVKILATLVLALTVGLSSLNTHFLLKAIDKTANDVTDLSFSGEPEEIKQRAEILFKDYKRREFFLSLTVSHEDLTDIESLFSEMIGYLSVKDTEGAEMTKSRLIDALMHLRRLSGVNISSIL